VSNKETLPSSPNKKRLFFALWPDDKVVQKIKQHAIKHFVNCQGRIVDKNNWHITLAYFGTADENTQACLEEQAEKIQSQPFELDLKSLGFWKKPKAAWLAPQIIPVTLKQLAFDIQQNLISCAYEPEKRDYQPHVTLVKKAQQTPLTNEIQPIHWHVDEFCLVESKTFPTGVEYQIIKRWDL